MDSIISSIEDIFNKFNECFGKETTKKLAEINLDHLKSKELSEGSESVSYESFSSTVFKFY